MAVEPAVAERREYKMKVLGRTLEHLGVQMYKRRDTAIAELVANSWDAGATEVHITLPEHEGYDPTTSEIVISDNGVGMDPDAIQDQYLVVGRNRRAAGDDETAGRPVMGRKGIGKLAGFGIADVMTLKTWTGETTTTLTLDMGQLKLQPGVVEDVRLEGVLTRGRPAGVASSSGARITLRQLKQKGAMSVDTLKEALARRFSRRVRGEMTIHVNGVAVQEPDLAFDIRSPAEDLAEAELADGHRVSYWYGFTETTLRSRELQGWTVLVRGKTAQAPGWFFRVETTASGQHGTKYFTGVIEADFLDEGSDDESDLIATDRQEIDWDSPQARALLEWGARITRDALIERVSLRGDTVVKYIYEDDTFAGRIVRLDSGSQERVKQYLRTLGAADAADEKLKDLADALIRAFEYRQFHDVVSQIEVAGAASPEELHTLLTHLHQWKVLESRAILEIVTGRLEIIDKLGGLLTADAPETAHWKGQENLHDLLGDYPWLINPEWQVLAEEKRVTTLLREWNASDIDEADRERIDFLALAGDGRMKLIEIKRGTRQVTAEEVNRLDGYRIKLERAENRPIDMILISGGDFDHDYRRTDIEVLTWAEMHDRARSYYEHFRAVLEGRIDDPSFARKVEELNRTREIIDSGTVWRGEQRRRKGLGPQDTELTDGSAEDGSGSENET